MWNDLDARADELVAGGVVAHLAAGAGTAFVQPRRRQSARWPAQRRSWS